MEKSLGMEVCLLMKASGSSNARTRQKRLGWGDMKEKREGGKEGRGGGEGKWRKENLVEQ